jgi:hypothetical protein
MRVFSDRFYYSPTEKEFSAESSDFCRRNKDLFHRLYQDACDEGITIISTKTGVEVDYYISECIEDNEGDLLSWILIPTLESLRKTPLASGTSVVIFND